MHEPDDAAAYRLNDEQALVVTTDFFTPIVDDPYLYGAIAAANSLSDVYAMGAQPLLALNLIALPSNLPTAMAQAIVQGMADKTVEAGCIVAGGHTIQDDEPKVGLAVVGLAHPAKLMRKGAAQPGDALYLTKPLGTGVIATAAKQDKADPAHLQSAAEWMALLNRVPSQIALQVGVGAATDITGFGLLGHGTEMANAANVTLELTFDAIPFHEGATTYADQFTFPGGTSDNMLAYAAGVHVVADLNEQTRMLLFDAQTSGGLLLAVPASAEEAFRTQMASAKAQCWRIGTVVPRAGDVAIRVVG